MNRNSGFTLLEIILTAALALIVGTFLIVILVNNSGFFYKQNAIISEGLDLNDAIREIDNSARQATAVTAGYPESNPLYTSDSQTLVLKLPALSQGGIIEGVYDYIVISKDPRQGKILRKQIFPDSQSTRQASDLILTTLLKEIEFKYLDKSGNQVSPTQATSIETNIAVTAQTGLIGSTRSSTVVTSLRNN